MDDKLRKIAEYTNQGDFVAILIADEPPMQWMDRMNINQGFDIFPEEKETSFVAMLQYHERFVFALVNGEPEYEDVRSSMIKHSRYGRILDERVEADRELIENILFPTYTNKDNKLNPYISFETVKETYRMLKMKLEFSKEVLDECIKFCNENEMYSESAAFRKYVKNT